MDWRLISAATLAGASFSVVAFGAYTLHAADSVALNVDRASPMSAPSLVPVDARAAGDEQAVAVRGVSFMPVEGDAVAAAGNPSQAQPVEGTPVLIADLPALSKEQDKGTKVFWNHRRHGTWRMGHHARFCTVLRPCEEKKQQVAQVQQQQVAAIPVRHEEHSTPKVALMIGVGF
jgi:hypothetical protein